MVALLIYLAVGLVLGALIGVVTWEAGGLKPRDVILVVGTIILGPAVVCLIVAGIIIAAIVVGLVDLWEAKQLWLARHVIPHLGKPGNLDQHPGLKAWLESWQVLNCYSCHRPLLRRWVASTSPYPEPGGAVWCRSCNSAALEEGAYD